MAISNSGGVTKTKTVNLGALFGRQTLPILLVGLVLWLARGHFPTLDMALLWEVFHQVHPAQWVLAALATGVSFWAVGRYDAVLHGVIGTDISLPRARQSGATSIAIAQFTGFGVITGALVRWHLLPNLSLSRAFQVSMAVSASFLLGWAMLTAGAVLLAKLAVPGALGLSRLVLTLAGLLVLILALRPQVSERLPTLQFFGKVLILVLMDTAFAALAFYLLLPAGLHIAPTSFFAAFLVALGVGLIGGTPGGIGPFELCMIALLPTVPSETLLASTLAFRIVYYVLPAGLGVVALLTGLPKRAIPPEQAKLSARIKSPFLPPDLESTLWNAPRAEANLIRQGEFRFMIQGNNPVATAAPVGQSLVMLGGPIRPATPAQNCLLGLKQAGQRQHRSPLAYKCPAPMALAARQLGWAVMPIAREAWLCPADFSTEGAGHRQLRRLIRKGEKAGVQISEAGRTLPLDAMQALSNRWRAAHGGEKGFSMGVFKRDYVQCQRVFLAHVQGRLVAFATFHETRQEWVLDLMRQDQDAPAGTMHMLIHHAIQNAASARCPRLSLAAVTTSANSSNRFVAELWERLLSRSSQGGLKQFKTSFQPHWETLYGAAPTRVSLIFGLWSVYRRINRPRFLGK